AEWLKKYDLADKSGPSSFFVNVGALQFLEHAWKHLSPGGALIVSEYGAKDRYPIQSYQLNHEEYSIHFGHLERCAEQLGLKCRLVSLKDFLGIDDSIPVLAGRQEKLFCLNHVLKGFGLALPFAVFSEREIQERLQVLPQELKLNGFSSLPLRSGFHFGPAIQDFMVLLMNKP